ncbi:hypothetical protein HOA92_00085 [archaeon]|jgi:hypothetical protein|nr:hypothetical protein [archaeon]MBT6761418.1 hypothetical protein [archaeon]
MNENSKESLHNFIQIPLEDRLPFLVERGLMSPEELEAARSSKYDSTVWHSAYSFICRADSMGEGFQSFVDSFDTLIEAEKKYDHGTVNTVLEQNPTLKRVYWATERETSSHMHNQILACGREMIRRKYNR